MSYKLHIHFYTYFFVNMVFINIFSKIKLVQRALNYCRIATRSCSVIQQSSPNSDASAGEVNKVSSVLCNYFKCTFEFKTQI